MTRIVDARGLSCPQPVVLTKKALEEVDEVTTIVDNETAKENVSRLAASQGCQVSIEEKNEGIYLRLIKMATVSNESAVAPTSESTILLITSDNLGRGNEELGNILMRSFIHTLGEMAPRPQTIIFINSGVKLVVKGSEVLDDLLSLTDQGVEILACGTCLGYYKLKEAIGVGQISNMYDIASTLLQAVKVITV